MPGKVSLFQIQIPKYREKSEQNVQNKTRYCGERLNLSTLSTEFSTFNFRNSHPLWKVSERYTIQHSIHNTSQTGGKRNFPIIPKLFRVFNIFPTLYYDYYNKFNMENRILYPNLWETTNSLCEKKLS